jgi:NitT/TauT family transport system ATP-binding protein
MDPLPHANIGRVTGLIELIRDKPGKHDVYRLGQHLHYELDDLLPITEAAKLCGFVKIEAGDIELTPLGMEFADADENRRKDIFKSRIEHLPIIRQIYQSLHKKRKKRISRETILESMRAHFSVVEAERQLQTAINWGRYAELFSYDVDSEEFYLDGG